MSGSGFWTHPVGTRQSANGPVIVKIKYKDDGDNKGNLTLDKYGRGNGFDPFLRTMGCAATPWYANPEGLCGDKNKPDWENVACLDSAPPVPPKV